MISEIAVTVEIATIAALVVSVKSLRSLTIVHDRHEYCDRRDRLLFYPSDRNNCDRWQSLGSLVITGKMKIGFHMIATMDQQLTSDASDRERSPTIIWKAGMNIYFLSKIKSPARTKNTQFGFPGNLGL